MASQRGPYSVSKDEKATDILTGFGKWFDVEPNTGCWLWIRAATVKGYPTVNFGGQNRLGHRVMYEIAYGKKIEEGMVVMHSCDQPSCVNPEHLVVGTHHDNHMDMVAKNREVAPGAKLTNRQVQWVRACNDLPNRDMGSVLGVSESTISMIKHGKRWRKTV